MAGTLFLQSEVQNPYKLYENMLRENPVYWDSENNLWAVYSYAYCKAVLINPFAQVPSVSRDNKDGLNEYALVIAGKIARLSNGLQHEIAKYIVMLLFSKMKAISISDIIEQLLQKEKHRDKTDWVKLICKKLPVLAVLKSFEFNEEDSGFISDKTELLAKIMLPDKSPEQVARINEISKEVYTIVEKHLATAHFYKSISNGTIEKYGAGKEEITKFCVCNLIGLFIQSYDAGRGILSNSLLQALTEGGLPVNYFNDEKYWEKRVTETLRFYPPVHNTKRIAAEDISLNDITIKKDKVILVALAAANRDPEKFIDPHIYNVGRVNNDEHLTFGAGGHRCPANYFSVNLAARTLAYLFERYKNIRLIENTIQYEPTVNTRLPKNIFIGLGR